MASVVRRLAGKPLDDSRICITVQHRETLDSAISIFHFSPDYDLNVMSRGKGLNYVSSTILSRLQTVLTLFRPDRVLVQGDTATTFAAGLAAFYEDIPVTHVEGPTQREFVFLPSRKRRLVV